MSSGDVSIPRLQRVLRPLGLAGWMVLLSSPAEGASTIRNEAAIAAVAQGLSDVAFADAWVFDARDATDATHITVRGHGAILRMRKRDYQQPPYTKAEWRMGLAFTGCRNVLVEGLRIESSGGDGIYIGSSKANRWCENVTIRNCVCHDNHRQGISVISAVHLLIENCTLSGTAGTPPEAGIDLEPDEPDERLVDCVIRNCVVADNAGNGILVWLKPLTAASAPVSIRFENCHVRMGPTGEAYNPSLEASNQGWSGFVVGEIADDGPRGVIEFLRCTSENTGREGVRLSNKSAKAVRVRFVSCRWKNTWWSTRSRCRRERPVGEFR